MSTPSASTRAVILAAGRGSRLGNLATELPKVMIELQERTLLAHQRRALSAVGIGDVHLVLGHGADAVERHPDAQGLTFWRNPTYATTNMVASLVCAPDLLDGSADLIVAYGDIVYEPRLLHALLAVDAPVTVVVDMAWRAYWEARMADPLDDAETLRLDGERILEIGKRPQGYKDIDGQYTGLIRIAAGFAARFAKVAKTLLEEDSNSPMTTLLQRVIDDGVSVQSAQIKSGWLEIDYLDDLMIDTKTFWSASQ